MHPISASLCLQGYRTQAFAPFSLPMAPSSIFCRGFALVGEKDALVLIVSPATRRGGNKVNLRHCSREEWLCYQKWPLAQPNEAEGWFTLRDWQPVVYYQTYLAEWVVECKEETWQLHWRADLDGYLELARDRNSFTLQNIQPRIHDPLFGWLHPATQFIFQFNGEIYQHCCWSGWPYRQRQLFVLKHGLPEMAARDPHWFDSRQDHEIWLIYLHAVTERLRVRAEMWDGWWQRFSRVTQPIITDGTESDALHLLRPHTVPMG